MTDGWTAKYNRWMVTQTEDGFETAREAIRYLEVGTENEEFSSISVISPEGVEYWDPDRQLENSIYKHRNWDELKEDEISYHQPAAVLQVPDGFFENYEKLAKAKLDIYEVLKDLKLVDKMVVMAEIMKQMTNDTKRWYDEQNFNAAVENAFGKDDDDKEV